MKKINLAAESFADLTISMIDDIKKRGYSHSDAETVSVIRENIQVLKDFDLDGENAVNVKTATAEK